MMTGMESIWLPHVRSDKDRWTGVTDEKERRRIQNRLAQRARRSKANETQAQSQKRQAQKRTQNSLGKRSLGASRSQNGTELQLLTPPKNHEQFTSEQDESVSPIAVGLASSEDRPLNHKRILGSPVFTDEIEKTPATVADCMALATVHDNFVDFGSSGFDLTIRAMHPVAALTHNAFALQIGCGALHTLTAVPTAAPASLRPTTLQAQVPHSPFIDCLPFSATRDRIISAKTFISIDMLADDVMHMGVRCWGRRPWDGRAWEFPEQFIEKWWWILDKDLVEMTNYWREERGEEALVWPGDKQASQVIKFV